MAWNPILDAGRYCKQCHQYRLFKPFDATPKHKVLDGLNQLYDFFGRQSIQKKETKEKTASLLPASKQNAQLCMNLIMACQKCDRTKPQVHKSMLLLQHQP